ncbi:hypothetical protein FJZ28_00560 [Candidatus Peregrinibacteria bacterium]|nr:hypothetical protein [Candidatus Peregrinibacteria bacterium]
MTTVRPSENSGQEVRPERPPTFSTKPRVSVRSTQRRLGLAGQIEGGNPYAVIGNAPDTIFTPEHIFGRTSELLKSLSEPEVENWSKKSIENIYKSLLATQEFAEKGKSDPENRSNIGSSLLVWRPIGPDKSPKLCVERAHLETLLVELDNATGAPPELKEKLKGMLSTIAGFNELEHEWLQKSILYRDPEAARRFAERSCRDPENIKTAGKLTLMLALGALLILNGIKDFSRGSLSFVTLATLGGLWFLLKKDTKYGFLKASNFTPIMVKYFTSEAEIKSFCNEYFAMTTKQKQFLTKQMSVRHHDKKSLTEDKLTKPKKNPADESPDAEVDETKAIPATIAQKMMAMSPEDGYVLANSLQGVKPTDYETMTDVLAKSRNATVRQELPTALGTNNEQMRTDAERARVGIVPSVQATPQTQVDVPKPHPEAPQIA